MAKNFIGILELNLGEGKKERVFVHKEGRSITLSDSKGSMLVHPQNEVGAEAWSREYSLQRDVKVEKHNFIPPYLLKFEKQERNKTKS